MGRRCCVQKLILTFRTIYVHNMFSSCSAKRRAFDKDLPVQCVQNWFVASLAVSDLMLGILVMPFSLSQEVVGYWLFGDFWCQVSCFFNILITAKSHRLKSQAVDCLG